MRKRLFPDPVANRDSCLLQYSRQQSYSDLTTVRIGYGQALLASRHVQVLPTCYWTLETKLS